MTLDNSVLRNTVVVWVSDLEIMKSRISRRNRRQANMDNLWKPVVLHLCPTNSRYYPMEPSGRSFDIYKNAPIVVAAHSKSWVCGRSLAGIAGSNSAGDINVCFF